MFGLTLRGRSDVGSESNPQVFGNVKAGEVAKQLISKTPDEFDRDRVFIGRYLGSQKCSFLLLLILSKNLG